MTVSKVALIGYSNVLQPARKKTKAEVMAEVIAKSKEHKVRLSAVHIHHIKFRYI